MLLKLEFKNPLNILYFLLPVLGLVIFLLSYRKKEKILGMLKIGVKLRFKFTRTVLSSLGLGLMAFSLLGPQIFEGVTEVKRTGLDIYVLIDTSKSMLVEDIGPNRISRAKKMTGSIIDHLEGDRIGFIPFSSDAYIQMPLTDDYQLARMFLEVIDTDMIGGSGTDIGTAIKLAYNSFERTSSADRVVIILSDGEEHASASLDTLKKIQDEHLKVFAIGIGSEKGGLIPVYDSGAQKKIDYKKDQNGNFITSRLMPETLKSLADSGRGSYYEASLSGEEINSLLKDISALKRDTGTTTKIRRYEQLYQYFLGAGLLLFLAAHVLPDRRKTG